MKRIGASLISGGLLLATVCNQWRDVCGYAVGPTRLRNQAIRANPWAVRRPGAGHRRRIRRTRFFVSHAQLPTFRHSYSVTNVELDQLLPPEDNDNAAPLVERPQQNGVDRMLATLTSAFPVFVLGAAMLGTARPNALMWVNHGHLISILLAAVMAGTGLTLEARDFVQVAKLNWSSIPLGVACQFGIMPLAAWLVGRLLLLPRDPALFLGLCLVGCSPGGTASNLVSLIAKADVALSVILTSCSTLLAVVVTPLLVQLLVGGRTEIVVSGLALCRATAQVVLGPVLLGMLLNAQAPTVARHLARFTPFASVLLVSVICGGVVAQNQALVQQAATAVGFSHVSLPILVAAVLLLHTLGFAAGYVVPKLLGKRERTARTISIEVGMQNSALAVVLAKSMGAPTIACLPGAISATAHSCLGSLLAAFWRIRGNKEEPGEMRVPRPPPEYSI